MASNSENIESYSHLSSTSENELEEDAELPMAASRFNKAGNSDDDGEHWKRALLARDLDMLHTCTLMIITGIPYAQRLQLSQNILDSLKDIKAVTLDEEKQEDGSGTPSWRYALLSRNLDLIETSLHIIMMNVPSSVREQLGRTIVAALQDLERVIQNNEDPAGDLIHCTEAYTENNVSDNKMNGTGEEPEKTLNDCLPEQLRRRIKSYPTYRGPLPVPEAPQSHEQRKKLAMEGICPICTRPLPGRTGKCPACKMFAMRMRERVDRGYYVDCDHELYSGGVACRPCRYYLFNLMTKEGIWN